MPNKLELVFSEFEHHFTKQKVKSINLSETIQLYLMNNGSKARVDKTIHNEFPIGHAYIRNETGRGFSVSKEYEITTENNEYFYIVYLTDNHLTLGRAKFYKLEHLVSVIFDWMENEKNIENIAKDNMEIEEFQPITDLQEERHKNWNDVKNYIFRTYKFYENNYLWEESYYKMLEKLAKETRLSKFIPFTSHYRLHLNNKNKSLKWHFIALSGDNEYLVAEQTGLAGQEPKTNKSFKSLDSATDFYYHLLIELDQENEQSI